MTYDSLTLFESLFYCKIYSKNDEERKNISSGKYVNISEVILKFQFIFDLWYIEF